MLRSFYVWPAWTGRAGRFLTFTHARCRQIAFTQKMKARLQDEVDGIIEQEKAASGDGKVSLRVRISYKSHYLLPWRYGFALFCIHVGNEWDRRKERLFHASMRMCALITKFASIFQMDQCFCLFWELFPLFDIRQSSFRVALHLHISFRGFSIPALNALFFFLGCSARTSVLSELSYCSLQKIWKELVTNTIHKSTFWTRPTKILSWSADSRFKKGDGCPEVLCPHCLICIRLSHCVVRQVPSCRFVAHK